MDVTLENIHFLDSPNAVIVGVRTARMVVEEVPAEAEALAEGEAPAEGEEKPKAAGKEGKEGKEEGEKK